MSHVTVLQGIVIRDVSAIRQAVQELANRGINVELVEGGKPRVHGYDSAPVCDYVLKLDGPYDVGLKRNENGNFDPVFDTYQNHVGNRLGASCPVPAEYERHALHQMGQFGQEYARFAAINQAASEGYVVESCDKDVEGNYQLILAVD